MKFSVVVNKSDFGYDVHCPTLKGCHSQGDTFEEAIENIKNAIKEYLLAVEELNKEKEVYKIEVAV